MPRFAFRVSPEALAELEQLSCDPVVVFNPAAEHELSIVRVIPRGFGANVLKWISDDAVIYQEPAVSPVPALEALRQHLQHR